MFISIVWRAELLGTYSYFGVEVLLRTIRGKFRIEVDVVLLDEYNRLHHREGVTRCRL